MRVERKLCSRHVGHRHLGGARALLMRNGPCRRKASAVRRSGTGHTVSVKLTLAALVREDPREGVTYGPSKTGSRGATRMSEVGRIGRVGDKTPAALVSLE